MSGSVIADGEEVDQMVRDGKTVRDLKGFLASLTGQSRFRQRLYREDMEELTDEMPLPFGSLQLVISDFCEFDQSMQDELTDKCGANQLEEVQALLQRPMNLSLTDEYGDATPIHLAAYRGHLEVVRLLLEAGAEKDARRADGKTALQLAAWGGQTEMVQLLLENGADVNVEDENENKALEHATCIGRLEVARLLIQAGAAKKDANKALQNAAFNGHLEIVRLLLETDAENVDAQSLNKEEALTNAACNGHSKVVQYLLEAGVDKNAARADGRTALHLAAYYGHVQLVPWLLKEGAGKNLADGEGATALELAKEAHQSPEILELLSTG